MTVCGYKSSPCCFQFLTVISSHKWWVIVFILTHSNKYSTGRVWHDTLKRFRPEKVKFVHEHEKYLKKNKTMADLILIMISIFSIIINRLNSLTRSHTHTHTQMRFSPDVSMKAHTQTHSCIPHSYSSACFSITHCMLHCTIIITLKLFYDVLTKQNKTPLRARTRTHAHTHTHTHTHTHVLVVLRLRRWSSRPVIERFLSKCPWARHWTSSCSWCMWMHMSDTCIVKCSKCLMDTKAWFKWRVRTVIFTPTSLHEVI